MKSFLKKNKQNETEGSKSESVKCKSKKKGYYSQTIIEYKDNPQNCGMS